MTKKQPAEISTEERLVMYRTAESALKELFSLESFCLESCISQPGSLYPAWPPRTIPGRLGCCNKNYFEMMRSVSEGTPTTQRFKELQKENATCQAHRGGECDYHSETGCQVKCYNTPICLGYVCDPYKYHLSRNYQVNYTWEVVDKLEKILKKGMSNEEFEKWLVNIQKATERVKKGKKKQKGNQEIIEV